MENYDSKNWVSLYKAAILELEHAKMSGRIEAARTGIAARLEKLQNMPGLHRVERQAIADALSGLRVVQNEESRYDEKQQRCTVDGALEKLRHVAPAILKNQDHEEDPD